MMYQKIELITDKCLNDFSEICILEVEENICISQVNRKINSLSHNEFFHLSEAGSPGWEFITLPGHEVMVGW